MPRHPVRNKRLYVGHRDVETQPDRIGGYHPASRNTNDEIGVLWNDMDLCSDRREHVLIRKKIVGWIKHACPRRSFLRPLSERRHTGIFAESLKLQLHDALPH